MIDLDNHSEMGQRLKFVMEELQLTVEDVAQKFGLNRNTVVNYRNGKTMPRADFLNRFSTEYEVNLIWLQTGVGDPLGSSGEIAAFPVGDDVVQLPILDVKASAGSGISNATPEPVGWFYILSDLIKPYDPKCIDVIRVSGDSMFPTLPQGSYIGFARGVIDNDGLYVINAGGELRVKRLHFFIDGRISLISDNKEYPEEIIRPEDLENNDVFIAGKVVFRVGGV